MKIDSLVLKQMLAAEFVLGTLRGGARRRFERMLREDRWLRGEVRFWEERFAAVGALEPVPARPLVWAQIQKRMRESGNKIVAMPAPRVGIFDAWRGWAILATAASAVLAVLLIRAQQAPPQELQERVVEVPVQVQTFVAALRLPDEEAQWTVSIAPQSEVLRIAANGPAKLGGENDYELWWVSESGVTSLGLLPRDGRVQRTMPAGIRVGAEGKVAVSREPAGGAPPGGGPTGPVLVAAPLMPSI